MSASDRDQSASARRRFVFGLEGAPALQRRVPPLRTELWLVVHRALRNVPRVAAVWDFLVEEASRMGYVPEP